MKNAVRITLIILYILLTRLFLFKEPTIYNIMLYAQFAVSNYYSVKHLSSCIYLAITLIQFIVTMIFYTSIYFSVLFIPWCMLLYSMIKIHIKSIDMTFSMLSDEINVYKLLQMNANELGSMLALLDNTYTFWKCYFIRDRKLYMRDTKNVIINKILSWKEENKAKDRISIFIASMHANNATTGIPSDIIRLIHDDMLNKFK